MVSAGTPPPNDRFAEATLLVGAPVSAEGSTAQATHEIGEPVVPGNTAGQSVWWTWTAPGNGLLTFTAAPNFFYSTALAVFGGETVDSLQLLGSNESIWVNRFGRELRMRDQLSVTVTAGRQYHIAADWNSYVPIGAVPGPVVVVCPDCPPPTPPTGVLALIRTESARRVLSIAYAASFVSAFVSRLAIAIIAGSFDAFT